MSKYVLFLSVGNLQKSKADEYVEKEQEKLEKFLAPSKVLVLPLFGDDTRTRLEQVE